MAIIAHASINENGATKGGKLGDNNGKEVCTRAWYNKPWGCVIRFTDANMREKIATCMEYAAKNDHIGYDQNKRNTLLNLSRKYNYNVAKVNDDCATDCSALVTVACIYAGIPESKLVYNGNCATTRTLKQILKATGEVDIFTIPAYTAKSDKLIRGDILLKEGSHVAVVIKADDKKPLDEIVKEVRAGKWGDGIARKRLLEAAGYNYDEVRKAVNASYSTAKK